MHRRRSWWRWRRESCGRLVALVHEGGQARTQRFTPEEIALWIVQPVRKVLEHAARGLSGISKAIKPANLILEFPGNSKLADFGLSRSTNPNGFPGTPVIIA